MENEEVLLETENPEGNQEPNLEQQVDEDLQAKLEKAEQIAKDQKLRAEKAEKELKTFKAQSPKREEVSQKSWKDQVLEARALNDVHEDDVEEVADYAERKKIPLYEARKSPYISAFLKVRAEERASAAAANTGTTKRQNQATAQSALAKASSNPSEMSEEEIVLAAKARLAAKMRK